jgi:esterase/lipase superfamily enzyme
MERQYARRWSPALGRDMELLRFGHDGPPLVAFPTSQGRFYQWEDFGLVRALEPELASGRLRLVCLDSVDGESWYAAGRPPAERVRRHLDYERYVLDEVLPEVPGPPVLAGPSFGAFHSVLFCLRHPDRFRGWVAMSGVYDNSRWLDGYHDADTYLTNPLAFLPDLADERYLAPLRAMAPLVVATGEEDANVRDSVRLGDDLRAKGVPVRLDVLPGWQHDWPYWQAMLRHYVAAGD